MTETRWLRLKYPHISPDSVSMNGYKHVLQVRQTRFGTDSDVIGKNTGPFWTDWEDVPVEIEV